MRQALEDAGYDSFDYRGGLAFNHRSNPQIGGKFADGLFTITEGTDANPIKRAYSARSVQQTAKKMGWRVTVDAKNPLKMQIRKRS